MSEKRIRTLESKSWVATLEIQPGLEFPVICSLQIVQELAVVRTLDGAIEELEGMKFARGVLRPDPSVEGVTLSVYDRPLLKLPDGRRFEVSFAHLFGWPAAVDFRARELPVEPLDLGTTSG